MTKKEKGSHASMQSLYWSINDALLSGNGFTSKHPFHSKRVAKKKKKVRDTKAGGKRQDRLYGNAMVLW